MASVPTGRPVTPLRQRMLDDMAMRSMRVRTQHDYVCHVRAFAAFTYWAAFALASGTGVPR